MARLTHIVDIGRGRPLVFLHGWAVDAALFAAQHELAKAGFRIIAADLPGHGAEPANRDLTVADLADALSCHLDEAGLEGAVLVGWSMGATVAFEYLARRGEGRVAGLVAVDMTAKVPNDETWPHGLRSGQTLPEMLRAADRMETDWPRYAPRIAEALFAPGFDAGAAAERVATRSGSVMAGLWRSLVAADHRGTVRRLGVPLLAVAGAESRLYAPEATRWLADNAPDGRWLEIPGAGHSPHVEQPEAFNAALAAFARALP